MWQQFRDPDIARRARCRLQGLHRAAFWRALGWPNLKRASAKRMEKRCVARMLAEQTSRTREQVRRAAEIEAALAQLRR